MHDAALDTSTSYGTSFSHAYLVLLLPGSFLVALVLCTSCCHGPQVALILHVAMVVDVAMAPHLLQAYTSTSVSSSIDVWAFGIIATKEPGRSENSFVNSRQCSFHPHFHFTIFTFKHTPVHPSHPSGPCILSHPNTHTSHSAHTGCTCRNWM